MWVVREDRGYAHGRSSFLQVHGLGQLFDLLHHPPDFGLTLTLAEVLQARQRLKPVLPTLPQLARELAEVGVRRLHLILPHQRGSLPARLDLIPSGEEMLAALRALLLAAERAGVVVDNVASWRRRLAAPQDLCTAGCRDLAIDP